MITLADFGRSKKFLEFGIEALGSGKNVFRTRVVGPKEILG